MSESRVTLGRVLAHHGLNGWLKVFSYTDPREQLFEYERLHFGEQENLRFTHKANGRGLLVKPEGVEDRTAAQPYIGSDLWLKRSELPAAKEGEYYWCDLEGCQVANAEGELFGTVKRVMATGANDVLVVAGTEEILIPFVLERYILEVDVDDKKIVVDWQADY